MSEKENIDLSRVVSLIMENPGLIEQISNLTKQKSDDPPSTEEIPEIVAENKGEEAESVASQPTYSPPLNGRTNRAQLLGALKPYVSKERAKAIDSMISIADILDMMRAR